MSWFTSQEQRDQFKALILKHVNDVLPKEEWVWLHERALDQLAGVMPYPEVDPDATPEQLINENVCEDGSVPVDSLVPMFNQHGVTEIGLIEGKPVLYLERTGIYLWDPKIPTGHYLSFWISFPAYPPGW